MFEAVRQFSSLGRIGLALDPNDPHIAKYHFEFKTSGEEKYRVEFHEFKHDLLIGKYYPNKFSKDPDKFKMLTNLDYRHAVEVISTVRAIFEQMYRKNSTASFGFIGEPSVNKFKKNKRKKRSYKVTENERITQRYRVYLDLAFRDLDPSKFDILRNESKSAVLLVNLDSVKNVEEYRLRIEQMMRELYEDYVDL